MNTRTIFLAALAAAGVVSAAQAGEVWRSNLDGNANAIVGTNGMPTGSPTPTADKNGNPGGAVLFNGSSHYTIPKQVNSFTAGSMSLWVRMDDLNGERGVVAVGASGGGTDQYFILQNEGGTAEKWRADVDDGVTRQDVLSNVATPQAVWQHLVATFTMGGSLRMYVDGVLQSDVQSLSNTPATLIPTSDWLIGSERATERRFIGAVDDVRIYDHELTQGEVTALFGGGPAYLPEPATLGVLGLAGMGLVGRRRRKA